MERIELEVLSSAINATVVKLPGRNFPGIVLQGDSLWILYNSIREVKRLCEAEGSDEAAGLASEALGQLSVYLRRYQSALEAHDIALPYNGEITD